jgi:hypothetical protein
MVAGAAYLVAADPSDGGVFPPCPFRALTGLWCPGCGLTRATHHLLRGDVVQALRYNVFVVLVLGALAATWLAWTSARAGRPIRLPAVVPARVYGSAIALLVVFAVVRNLPGIDGLRG